jgi:hypothetical protein
MSLTEIDFPIIMTQNTWNCSIELMALIVKDVLIAERRNAPVLRKEFTKIRE